MFELPPMFLALAFVLVGVATYFLGRRNGAARTVRLPRDYYVGLDHLINDRFDHAAEVFSRMAQADGDATEIQFALGSLFRRRGEVDRAIAIHSRLRDHGLSSGLRDKAAFALALDYQSAGLMDRSEQVLEELAASSEYRRAALDHLVSIYEAQGDWAKALKVFHELPPAVQGERARIAAHYLCELAEHALLQGDAERAGDAAAPGAHAPGRTCRARTSSRRASPMAPAMPPARCCCTCRRCRHPRGWRWRSSRRCWRSPGAPAAPTHCARWACGCSTAGGSARASSPGSWPPRSRPRRWAAAGGDARAGPGGGFGRRGEFAECAADAHRRCRRALPVR